MSGPATPAAVSFPPQLPLSLRDRAAGSVRVPGSKSYSNRALLLAALAGGTTRIHHLLHSDDTAVMIESLRQLGVLIEAEGPQVLRVHGMDGVLRSSAEPIACFVGNSGLTIRTLLPALVLGLADREGTAVRLHGVARMHERPIADLVEGLRAIGAHIECEAAEGFPPLRLHGRPLDPQAELSVRGNVSSQFLTGLLQIAPGLAKLWDLPEIIVRVEGELISRPYIDLTLALLSMFGAQWREPEPGMFWISPAPNSGRSGLISPGDVTVEGDASSASYFLAAGALGGGPLAVLGVGSQTLQGDVAFAQALSAMGARVSMHADSIVVQAPASGRLQAIDWPCGDIPDAAMTLVPLALYAEGTTHLRGIGSWRVKETDRIAAMATEARKLGAVVAEGPDWLSITPPAALQSAEIATYDDHRVAMSFALCAFAHPGDADRGRLLTILEPGCVAKTYPEFFNDFARVAAQAVPVIAIDGPSASGKGTVAARVAEALGLHYLDSGALYRCLGLLCLEAGLDPNTAVQPEQRQRILDLAARHAPQFVGTNILLQGRPVGEAIRTEAVGQMASCLAALPEVRAALLRQQHDFARSPGLVADGRDMSTVVFPGAVLKVFLTATAEARAERRYKQLIEKGFSATLSLLQQDLEDRDRRDRERPVAPLLFDAEAGMVMLDTTRLSISEAVEFVLQRARPLL